MQPDTYRVGIVGCGGIGRAHAAVYRDLDRTTVAAAADLDSSTLAAFADRFDVDATYGEYADMLGSEDLDLVSICTWHSTHAEITIEAAEAGADGILCEKPMSTSVGETRDMIDAAERNDARLAVAHQRRFDPLNETARDLIADGAIGDPVTVTVGNDDGLLNFGSHMVDIARYLLGDPETDWVMGQVQRRTDRHERGEPIEDRCLGHVCFDDGVRLTYESDMPEPDLAGGCLRVTGTEGVLTLDFRSSVTVVNGEGASEYEPDSSASTRPALVRELVEWMDGERETHRCSGVQAGETMEILMGFYESVRTNGVVHAPVETRANPLKLMIEDGSLPVERPGKYDIRLPYASVLDPHSSG